MVQKAEQGNSICQMNKKVLHSKLWYIIVKDFLTIFTDGINANPVRAPRDKTRKDK